MKLLKIEKQNDFIYITYEKTYLFFFKKVFTDRIVCVTEYFYLLQTRVPYKRFVLCKNGEKMKNSGMIAYAWYVWDKDYKGKPTIEWIL